MRLFGLDVSVRKAAPRSLSPVDDSGGGWVTIHDFAPGTWQRDEVPVHPERARTNWAVFACQTLIAGDVGKLGVKLTEWNSQDKIYDVVDSPAASPFFRKPNAFQTWQKFVEYWILSKVDHGNAYILKERDARGVVVAGYVLDPRRVTPLVSQNGSVFYSLGEDLLSRVDRVDIVVPASEIIHDRYWCLFHPLVGVSPLYACALAATQGLWMQEQQAIFFRNSAVPSGLLVSPQRIDDKLAADYKKRWEQNYSGAQRGRTAVLGNGLEYKPIALSAVENAVVDQLKLTAEMVCSVYHVPPYKVGIGPIPPYDSADTMNQIYYDVCLQPLVQAVEASLDEGLDLPKKGFRAQLDEDDLLRMDATTQIEVAGKGIEKAIFSPNEGRRRFNMPPVKGGESPMLQQQMFSLAALAKRDAKEDPFASANNAPPNPNPAPAPAPGKGVNVTDKRARFGAALRRAAA